MKNQILFCLFLFVMKSYAQTGLQQRQKVYSTSKIEKIVEPKIITYATKIIEDVDIEDLSKIFESQEDSMKKLEEKIKNFKKESIKDVNKSNLKIDSLTKILEKRNLELKNSNDILKKLNAETKTYLSSLYEIQINQAKSNIEPYNKYFDELMKSTKRSQKTYKGEPGEIIHKIDSLYDILTEKLNGFKLLKTGYDDKVSILESNLKSITDSNEQKKSSTISNFNEKVVQINKKNKEIHNELQPIIDKLEQYKNTSLTTIVESINSIITSFTAPIPNSDISTMPEIISNFGGGLTLPSLNLLGTNNFNWNNFTGDIKVFSTANNSNNKFDWRTLTLAESSNFGILVNIIKAFNKADLGDKDYTVSKSFIRFNSGYVNKSAQMVKGTDTTNFNFSMFHFRPGYEYILADDIISIYADMNLQYSVTNLEKLVENFNLFRSGNLVKFVNTGVRFKINTMGQLKNKSNTSSLLFDLNFVWLNKGLNGVANNFDKVLPILKTSFKF